MSPTPAGKTYGGADPTLAGILEGFLAVDGVTAAFSRTPGEDAGGDYIISASLSPEARLANCAITYNTAAFTIALRPIEVTADAASKYVGGADPPLTHRITSGALAAGDAFTGALSREPARRSGSMPSCKATCLRGRTMTSRISVLSSPLPTGPRP